MTHKKLTHLERFAKAGRMSVAGALLACPQIAPVFAAESEIEEVVVTGSRIERSNATAAQPLSMIDGDQIRQSGTSDIGEILNKNPALLSSITGTNSIDEPASTLGDANDSVGGGSLDLRGLGFQRTLTLVNGRRHVAGVEGTSAVDVGTIPSALIERVEILTGGASAVYGADAVTGVVNFILKEDYEGMEFDFRPGISEEGDDQSYEFTFLAGTNFDEGRGNLTFSFQSSANDGLRQGDRSYLSNDGLYDNDTNPQLRFQQGEINGDTPNFAQFYDYDTTGRFSWGLSIPDEASFVEQYTAEFGSAPTLTAAETALMQRAGSAYPQAILPGRGFNITSAYGTVAIGDFGSGEYPLGSEPDLDGNGTSDCLQSFTGYNSSLGGASSFGAAGGCWVIDSAGNVVPVVDGAVADNFNQFGMEQAYIAPDRPYVIPKTEKYAFNLNGRYEITPALEAFVESKFVYEEITFGGGGHNYTDLLYGAPDNPYLPEELAAYANNSGVSWLGPGGLYVSRDSDDWGDNISTNERTTIRIVGGFRGSFDNGIDYEASLNYGRFERKLKDPETQIADRFFAAIDVVADPVTGEPICRSDLDPTAYAPTTPFNIFPFVGSGQSSPFFTFTPGDGQCQPANIWGGEGAISQEAIDFFTYDRTLKDTIEQTVFNAFIAGETTPWFELPAGPMGFAIGFEYRDESSAQSYDDYDRGIIQVNGITPDGQVYSAGDLSRNYSQAQSLGGTPATSLNNGSAGYDVWDVFAEVSVPVLSEVPGAYELTVDGAVRYADYEEFGGNTTYGIGATWAPIMDLRVRGSYNLAVRVPNIFELYSPEQGTFGRPTDACDATQIQTSVVPDRREENCVAELRAVNVPDSRIFDDSGNYAFEDPLSAGFPINVSGNPELKEETATTVTFGFVLTPSALPGMVFSLDYWDIEIEDAIRAPSSQNIVDSCYDGYSLNSAFCSLLTRETDPLNAQSGGLRSVSQSPLNFGAADANGIDFALDWSFEVASWLMMLNTAVTWQDTLDYTLPLVEGEEPLVDQELGEMRRPEWASQIGLSVAKGPFTATWRTQFLSEQTLAYEDGVEIETVDENYGPDGYTDDIYFHDLTASWQMDNGVRFYGGIENVTNEKPYVTERAYPVSPRGRYFFAGINVRLFN